MTAQRYGDFTIMMNTSLGDVSCPAGVQNEDITHMHKSFTLYSHNVPMCTLQQHSISSTYILKYRMETEIKLNKTLGAEAGLV